MKIISLSFDDGTIYDEKFIELLDKYNIKATFNLNSGINDFVWFYNDEFPIARLNLNKAKHIFDNHEVASHSLTHPYFSSLDKESIIKEVREDIKNLENIFHRKIEGFAFPFFDQSEDNILTVKNNIELEYIRYSYISDNYEIKDRYHIPIHAFYDDEDIYEKIEKFKENKLEKSLFVIAGHSYEFEVKNDWDKIEKLLIYLNNLKDVKVVPLKDAVKVLFN